MARVEPLTALRYDLERVGGLRDVVAPPYDVIDAERRAALLARSPHNAVRIDLPQEGEDPYAAAAQELGRWEAEGAVVRDREPAVYVLEQRYTAPGGGERTRTAFLARVRVEAYGAGRIRPHERTHPGPKEDRLRLTRATRANLSPIFSLYADASGAARAALDGVRAGEPWGEASDDDGTANRVWRVTEEAAIAALTGTAAASELLIADGHHRYETARVYADEIGGEGPHRYALMALVALEDPGLTVFPTHRLVSGLTSEQQEALRDAILRDFDAEPLEDPRTLEPEPAPDGAVRLGYIDAHHRRPYRLTLKDSAIASSALPGRAEAYRRLDTAVLEALLLEGALGYTPERIDHLDGFGYARDLDQALELVESRAFDAAFVMGATPVEHIREVAAAGESMPPKSTYFFPKIPTGVVFNPLV